MLGLGEDFDIPFNCESFPLCTLDDFNKTITSDVSVAEYSFDIDTITYVEANSDRGTTITEVLTILGFSSLEAGAYHSQLEGDSNPTVFILNEDNTGTWSHGSEGGSITWSVKSDGVLVIAFETGDHEEYI